MNRVLLNTVPLDGGVIIKGGGGGGVTIKNQEKSVDITENGTTEVVADAGFTGLSKVSVNVNVPSEGGAVAASSGAINFKDYDGTILHSYTKDAFLALAEMPTLPTRQGLTCQGWNWSLEDAKAYVGGYGVLDIGATYITDDGKTRLYITIAAEGRMDVPIYFKQTVANGVAVDWGDGSEAQTYSSTAVYATHHYDSIGDYVITLEVLSGELILEGTTNLCILGEWSSSGLNAYPRMLKRMEIGENVNGIGNYILYGCYSLSSLIIPNGVTKIVGISCYSLSSVVIPNSVTSIGSQAFFNCYSLSSVVIPNSVTSIADKAFYYCYSLSSVVIPNGVTSIGSKAFYHCYSLSSVVIPNSVTSIGSQAFYYCHSLSSVVIPNGVTSIEGYTFSDCYSLSSVVIPNSVTSIGSQAFSDCYSLSSVVIPNSVTSIGSQAFYYCSSVAFFDFSGHTSVPTLSNYNAFSSIASDCKIVVPDELYDSWIAATNWSSVASYIVKASEFNG